MFSFGGFLISVIEEPSKLRIFAIRPSLLLGLNIMLSIIVLVAEGWTRVWTLAMLGTVQFCSMCRVSRASLTNPCRNGIAKTKILEFTSEHDFQFH